MKAKSVIFFICVIALLFNTVPVDSNEKTNIVIVIADKAYVKETNDSTSKTIKELAFGEEVEVLNDNKEGMLYIKTKDDQKGWIKEEETSYIPENWVLFEKVKGVKFYVPNEQFSFIKSDHIIPEDTTGKAYTEDKLYNKNYFILIHHIFDSVGNELKRPLNLQYYKKKIIKDNIAYYYLTGIERDSNKLVFKVLLAGKKSDCYDMVIFMETNTKINQIRAKKMIFSFGIQ